MRILRAAGNRVMPWKNGGGTTTEIAVSPEGAGLEDFDWRISTARVETDGPFSLFPGVDRTLAILDAAGMVLAIEGREPVRLDAKAPPFFFPADLPTEASLTDGAITDLNVMTRRGRMTHSVERRTDSLPFDIEPAHATVLFCSRDTVRIKVPEEIELQPGDALLLGGEGKTIRAAFGNRALLFVIRIRAENQNG